MIDAASIAAAVAAGLALLGLAAGGAARIAARVAARVAAVVAAVIDDLADGLADHPAAVDRLGERHALRDAAGRGVGHALPDVDRAFLGHRLGDALVGAAPHGLGVGDELVHADRGRAGNALDALDALGARNFAADVVLDIVPLGPVARAAVAAIVLAATATSGNALAFPVAATALALVRHGRDLLVGDDLLHDRPRFGGRNALVASDDLVMVFGHHLLDVPNDVASFRDAFPFVSRVRFVGVLGPVGRTCGRVVLGNPLVGRDRPPSRRTRRGTSRRTARSLCQAAGRAYREGGQQTADQVALRHCL